MKRQLVFALLSVFVLGCQSELQTRKYWSKPNTTLEQAIEDCKKCKETARGKAQEGHYNRYRDRVENNNSVPFNSELERMDRDFDNLHSFRSCMRSLEYQQVPEHRLGSDMRKANRFGGGEIQHLAGD